MTSCPDWPGDAPALAEVADFVHQVADAARALVRAEFRGARAVSYKSDRTPVTDVDRKVEALIRDAVRSRFPRHGVVGEELGAEPAAGGPYTWVVDPIDGTKAFMTGKPLFGTLIALVRAGAPILGLIDVPILAERWLGAAGAPTRLNGRPCRASGAASLAEATLHSTTIDMFVGPARAAYERLSAAVRFRAFGGDCYNYALLASGYVDLVVEADLKGYDYLALVPVVTGAGGVITDWRGAPLSARSPATGVVAAANPSLHRAALERLGDG